MKRNSREIIQEVVQRSAESVEDFLQWSQEHQGCTLSELEKELNRRVGGVVREALEAGVALQEDKGVVQDAKCSCGGKGVFQGYRERQVVSGVGVIRMKRAYFTCERCGQGFFPPG